MSVGRTGVNIHMCPCPVCGKEFYVHMPNESDGVFEEDTECVECDASFVRQYEFTEREESIDVEVEVLEDEQG